MPVEELVEMVGTEEGASAHQVACEALRSGAEGCVFARFERPRAETPTRIGIVSDPHVATDAEGTWKVFHRTRQHLQAALRDLASRGVDAIAFSGDLTKDGAADELAAAAEVLADVDVPTLAVPGNHDLLEHPTDRFATAVGVEGYPVHRRVGGVDLVGLDTGNGAVGDDQRERLDALLTGLDDPVVVAHHNLPGLESHVGREWAPHSPVGDAESVVEVLARHDVPLHVSGHVHLPAVTVAGGVRGLVAPSLASFPHAYLLLDIDDSGTTVRCLPVADDETVEAAYRHACEESHRARLIADLTGTQLRSLPVVDERETGLDDVRTVL